MRILLVADWMTNAGGTEVAVVELRSALQKAGHDVWLVACGADIEPGADIVDQRVFGSDNLAAQVLLQVVNPMAASGVKRVVLEFAPDVAIVSHFAYHLSPAVFAALRPVPTILSVTDYKATCPVGSRLLPDRSLCDVPAGAVCWRSGCVSLPHWLRDQPRYALINRSLAHVGAIVTPSTWMADSLRRDGITAEVLPLPVPPVDDAYRRDPSPDPLFVYAGRLSREKGIDVLVRAFARVLAAEPRARLRVVGDGPVRAEAVALVEALGVGHAVEWTGRAPPDAVGDRLRDAWALLAPSLWAEPFGLVVAEAIVRSVPVLASATGGFAETVEDGVTGLLVPNGDEAALATAMSHVATGAAFPGHRLPATAVARLAGRLSPQRYVRALEVIIDRVRQGPA